MSLDKRHYSPNKDERTTKQTFHPIYKMKSPAKKEFDRVEALLDEVTVDVVNGIPKSEIFLKLTDKEQLHYPHQNKALSYYVAEEYWRAIEARLALDRNRDCERVKDALYAQYLNIYREAVEMGNLMVAKATLDSLQKLYGIDKPNQTNVQINSGDENKVEIKFGFDAS